MQLLAHAIGATMLRRSALPQGMAWSLARNVGRKGMHAGLVLDAGLAYMCSSGARCADTAIQVHRETDFI